MELLDNKKYFKSCPKNCKSMISNIIIIIIMMMMMIIVMMMMMMMMMKMIE